MQLRNGVQVDTISAGRGGLVGSGDVAMKLLQSGFNINALRANDVLRKDEWLQIDRTLIEIARKRLIMVGLLMSRNLQYNISNGLGTTILEWERVSDMEPANVSMSGVTEGEGDTLEYDLQSMPLPIIHKDFTINIRKLHASRTTGQPLDMAQVELASRLVSETTEAMVFNGHATRVGNSVIYGLLTQPDRNVGAVTGDWDLIATTGANKVADTIAMIQAAQDDDMYGPYVLLVTQTAFTNLAEDYKAESDKTQMARLNEIPGIEAILPSKDMPAGSIALVQLTRDVIDEVVGLQPTVVQWESRGGMMLHFKVMSIMIPRVRSTQSGQSGIVHFS